MTSYSILCHNIDNAQIFRTREMYIVFNCEISYTDKMSFPNVVILNDYGQVNGGTSQVAITTALILADKGFRVYFFCAVPPIDFRLQNHTNIRVICTEQPDILTNPNRIQAAAQGLWNFTSAEVMRKLLSTLAGEDTIVHIHGWTKALSHSPIFVAIKARFPVLITIHDYFLACPNGGFYNFPQDNICNLKALSPRCILTHCDSRSYPQKIWRVARAIIQKKVALMPSGIHDFITLSNLSCEIVKPYLHENAHIYLLPNPIETEKLDRVEVEKNHKYFAVGRLSPEKGMDLFARAALERGVETVFAGDGPLMERLEKINPNAQFLGWLPRSELIKSMRDARALVFCSKLYETHGMVLAEAASMGIPSIVSNVTAGKELILDNETGLLFHSNDQADLMAKIQKLQDDTTVRNLSCNVYKQFWRNPPILENYSNNLKIIYSKILKTNVKPSSQRRR